MKTKQELIEKQKAELAKFDHEEAIRAELPEAIRDASICIHNGFATAAAWSGFRTSKKLLDAIGIVREMESAIIDGEHWKDGCVSTWPAEINSCAKNERATLDGSHAVEVEVSGGKGFGPDVKVCFWAKLPSGLIEIQMPVCDLWKLVPSVRATYNNHGDLANCTIDWPTESRCVDSFRKFWSEKPSYNGSYYLADLPNFYSWASNMMAPGLSGKAVTA